MFNYGDIIEYVDGTYDENFNKARKWANSNRASFNELIDIRKEIDGVLHRFYEIKEIIVSEPSEEEIKNAQIAELKQKLADTDYKAIKYAEGEYTDEEYEPIKEMRKEWRRAINELEEQL